MPEHQETDADALGFVFAECHTGMTRLARSLLRTHGIPPSELDAEDVVQAAFAAALRAPARVREPRAYLKRVICQQVQDHVRIRARRRPLEERRAADPTRFDAPVTADIALQVVARAAVDQSLRQLPPDRRGPVLLTKGYDYPRAEAAILLGKAPGTIATHVSRAVRTLRITLGAAAVAALGWLASIAADLPRSRRETPVVALPQGVQSIDWSPLDLLPSRPPSVLISTVIVLGAVLALLMRGLRRSRSFFPGALEQWAWASVPGENMATKAARKVLGNFTFRMYTRRLTRSYEDHLRQSGQLHRPTGTVRHRKARSGRNKAARPPVSERAVSEAERGTASDELE
ncbi:RNA polymerase sigma factor [Streptomyces aculeolatus]